MNSEKAWGNERLLEVVILFPEALSRKPRKEHHRKNKRIPSSSKGVSIKHYSAEQILWFAGEINELSRKLLEYTTPEGLFDKVLNKVHSIVKVQVA